MYLGKKWTCKCIFNPWQTTQGWMKDCGLQSWFENCWEGEQRKQPDHWPLAGSILYTTARDQGLPQGEKQTETWGRRALWGGRGGWGCCWKSSRKGEVERRGELSRGKVIGLGERAQVVRMKAKRGCWGGRGGGGVPYWWGGEGGVGSEVRWWGKKRGEW